MEPEEIFINLKVLESLDKDQKLISRGPYMNVEPQSIIPEWLRRWHRQDNRNECIKKINLIVNSAIEYIEHQVKKEKQAEISNKIQIIHRSSVPEIPQNIKDEHDMIIYLEKSLKGIQNLKETYSTCSQTCARIDVIINKILNSLNTYRQKEIQEI
jgi:hypothetical protein